MTDNDKASEYFRKRTPEAIQTIAAANAHFMRGDEAEGAAVLGRLAPDAASMAMNQIAFSLALTMHAAKRLGIPPEELLQDVANEAALMGTIVDGD